MSNWLASRTTKCTEVLKEISRTLADLQTAFIKTNDAYFKQAKDGTAPAVYQGQGAIAFLDAVSTDINKSKMHTESIGHVGSAARLLADAINTSSQSYDSKLLGIGNDSNYEVPQTTFDRWRDNLIDRVLDAEGNQANLMESLLKNGSQGVLLNWEGTRSQVEGDVQLTAALYFIDTISSVRTFPQPDLNDTGTQQLEHDLENKFMTAFHNLANTIKGDLTSWADEVQAEYNAFQGTMNNPDYLSARDIFSYIGSPIDHTQNTTAPITITPYTGNDGKKGLMITIAGTDTTHWWDTSLITALQTGEGIPNNPYMADVKNAILTYMSEHPEMSGANVTLAGYSLGGMIAQNWADKLNSAMPTDLTRYNLHVTNVVTYGAPVMGPPSKGVQYQMYDAIHDPIPLLSKYENPLLNDPNLLSLTSQLVQNPVSTLQAQAQELFDDQGRKDLLVKGDVLIGAYQSLQSADQLPWNKKVSTYLDPTNAYQGHIYNINDVGNTSTGTGVFSIDPWYKNLENGHPFTPGITPGHELDFKNHTQYQASNQLNSVTTAQTNINPATLGPTEYFGSYADQ